MTRPDPLRADEVNWTQYDPSQSDGHYESYYLRGNHPERPLAFWIRYTIFSPAGRPADALGELWAIVFDGETGTHTTAKLERPFAECAFARDRFSVRIGSTNSATLDEAGLHGEVGPIAWDLRYEGDEPPLYLLPARLYRGGFPKAKSLVSRPLARFTGSVSVGDRTIDVDGWLGSQNHNWGSRHTDHYAFGQVAGFDNAPESFLEVATARNRLGPLWTPALTPLVLRHGGREHALTAMGQMFRATAAITPTRWTFATQSAVISVAGTIEAPADAFVLLEYANPPGGTKYCHNTKLARCELTLTDRVTGQTEVLRSSHKALFEILDDHESMVAS
jgi:hypothetical protein